MRAVLKTEPAAGATLLDVPIPVPGPGEVLIKVKLLLYVVLTTTYTYGMNGHKAHSASADNGT